MKKVKTKQTIKFTAVLLAIVIIFIMIPFSVSANGLNNDFIAEEDFEILESGTLMALTIDEDTGEAIHISTGTLVSDDCYNEFSEGTDAPMTSMSNDYASLTFIIARYSNRVEVTFWYFTTNPMLHGSSVNVSGTVKVDGHIGVSPNAPSHLVNQSENFSTAVALSPSKKITFYLAAHHINERLRMNVTWTYGSETHDAIIDWDYITTNWHRGTFASVLASVNYHYIKHRQDFGATNIVEFCNWVDMLFNEVNNDLKNMNSTQLSAKYAITSTPMGDAYEYRWRPTLKKAIRIHNTNKILTAWFD
jgi:hypothetical protein